KCHRSKNQKRQIVTHGELLVFKSTFRDRGFFRSRLGAKNARHWFYFAHRMHKGEYGMAFKRSESISRRHFSQIPNVPSSRRKSASSISCRRVASFSASKRFTTVSASWSPRSAWWIGALERSPTFSPPDV